MVDFFLLLFLLVYVLIASIYDFKYKIIPNKLTVSFFLISLIINIVFYDQNILSFFKSFVFSFVLFLPLYYLKIFSGGDYKMVISISAFLGLNMLVDFLLLAVLFTGFLALVGTFINNKYKSVFNNLKIIFLTFFYPGIKTQFIETEKTNKQASALSIGIAAIIVYTNTWRIFY